jgi:CRP-like cAMP-binding protein
MSRLHHPRQVADKPGESPSVMVAAACRVPQKAANDDPNPAAGSSSPCLVRQMKERVMARAAARAVVPLDAPMPGAAAGRDVRAGLATPVGLCRSVGVCRSYAKRHTIFRQGDPATHLYRVESGAVALELFIADGRRQLVEILVAGDLFGFTAAGVLEETAIALEPTVVCVMRLSDLERTERAGWAVARQAGRQIARSYDHLLALGRKNAQERLCQLLLRLARDVGDRPAPARNRRGIIRLHVPLTRGEMGDYLGLSLETVCRTMSALQQQRLIRVGPRQGDVVILALDELRRRAG